MGFREWLNERKKKFERARTESLKETKPKDLPKAKDDADKINELTG